VCLCVYVKWLGVDLAYGRTALLTLIYHTLPSLSAYEIITHMHMRAHSTQVMPYIAGLIPNLLVVCNSSSREGDVPCQLLALQCLVAVTRLPSAHRICKANKLTVSSGLGELMDHPSLILRQAAVETRNTWYILE